MIAVLVLFVASAAGADPQVFRDCPQCPEMVVVPAGSFTMGSPEGEKDREADEGPQHGVTIPRAIAMGKYEVTRGEFAAFVGETG
ncbi:MAG: formylglycine-generating enzyme family protein, partial [Kiloniellales bacterium]